MLSSHPDWPNNGTKLHHLLGYVSLLSITMRASMPVAFVVCTQVYASGELSASARFIILFFANLRNRVLNMTYLQP